MRQSMQVRHTSQWDVCNSDINVKQTGEAKFGCVYNTINKTTEQYDKDSVEKNQNWKQLGVKYKGSNSNNKTTMTQMIIIQTFKTPLHFK